MFIPILNAPSHRTIALNICTSVSARILCFQLLRWSVTAPHFPFERQVSWKALKELDTLRYQLYTCSHAAAQKWSHAHQSSVVPFTRSPELWSFSERSLLRFPPLPLLHHNWKPLLFKNYHFITRKQFFLWMVVGQLPTFMAGLCW